MRRSFQVIGDVQNASPIFRGYVRSFRLAARYNTTTSVKKPTCPAVIPGRLLWPERVACKTGEPPAVHNMGARKASAEACLKA